MTNTRFSRQSFLGSDSERQIKDCVVGVVGLGGGGSHVVQQLAHVGFQNYVLCDDDIVEESNLNRLVGARSVDVLAQTQKLHLAKMMIYGLQQNAKVMAIATKWQTNPEPLKRCAIIFGCLDGYQNRQELEIFCRRYLIHFVDIGMDVHGKDKPVIGGQVILSSPGEVCMKCLGFLSEQKLAEEAGKYGDAGENPQVIWPNGVLASAAVGIGIDLCTGWTKKNRRYAYLVYDGNEGTLKESITLKGLENTTCQHFPLDNIGDPIFTAL